MFNVSEKAVNEISRLLSEEEDKTMFLRIRVVPGGCSGFEYEMGFDNEIDGSDEVFEENIQKNLKIVDLTGAGDLFAAGFLHGHINKLPIKECLEKGTEMSSRVIQQIGARL